MCSKELLLLACLFLLGGLRLTSTTTTTTFVAAMSIANQDLDRYFRTANATQILANEERILIDTYYYAHLNYTYYNDDDDGDAQKVSFNEEKARYGEGKAADCEGKLVHISNLDDVTNDTACTRDIAGTNQENFPPPGVTWIALVRRGHCTFEQKVKHVNYHGACGVIIYNDKLVNNLEKMQIKDQTRDITAVITYLDIGLDMARIVDQGLHMEVAIRRGRSGSRPINTLNKTSVLFVSISFIVLMVISLVWLLFYYIQRFRYLQTKDQQSRQLCSVTKKAIMKIPTKTGKTSDEKDLDSDCCAICIEAYKPSDCIRVLPCKHEFHKNCIDPWLIEHRTCPMCKLDVLKFYGYVVGDQIHATPSPQYVPPNIDNVGGAAIGGGGGAAGIGGIENDVEVIVVALGPPYSATQPTTTTQTQQQTQSNAMQLAPTQATQLPASRLPTSAAHAQQQQQQQLTQLPTHTHLHHCASVSVSNGSDNNCCLQQSARGLCQQHSCEHTRNTSSSNNSNGASHTDSAHIVRRNSAPLVLQVSTASHKVTDV